MLELLEEEGVRTMEAAGVVVPSLGGVAVVTAT